MKRDDTYAPLTGSAKGRGWTAASTARLLAGYTLLFAVFFIAAFSPFVLYGKAFLWGTDGISQHVPLLDYAREWLGAIPGSLRPGAGIPEWSLRLGFGQGVLVNVINLRASSLAYALLGEGALETFLWLRAAVGLYLTGLSFIAYARTRCRDAVALLAGSLLYAFSGFSLFIAARHTFFLEMTAALPLMLLGIDRVFRRRGAWLFTLIVALTGLSSLYFLFMLTIPAVVYALFRFFGLTREQRRDAGGFWGLLARCAGAYLCGALLAGVAIVPTLLSILSSSRTGAQAGLSLLCWEPHVYLSLILGVFDMEQIGAYGVISLPSLALVAVCCALLTGRRRSRALAGQLALCLAAFLVPALTMLFSGFAGKTLRWCFIFAFWAAVAAALALPRLRSDDGRALRRGLSGFVAALLIYIAAAVWTGRPVSFVAGLACAGAAALLAYRRLCLAGRRNLAGALLLVVLLAEITARSFQLYSPQYGNFIGNCVDAGRVRAVCEDNAAGALAMVDDDGVYRTDVITVRHGEKNRQTNYGLRNGVNGVSSYYSLSDARIADYALGLGDAHQSHGFHICDLGQRTVLDALAGVKYAAAFTSGARRVPYGYEAVASGEKTLSDGTTTTQTLYENQHALRLSYAYETCVPRRVYDALPPNRKEQAMLQGVVLEGESPLPEAALTFDDRTVLGADAFMDALRAAAESDDALEVSDGIIRAKKADTSVSLPIEKTRGEILLQILGVRYTPVNFREAEAASLREEGAAKLTVAAAERDARTWSPEGSAFIVATSGKLSDFGTLLAPGQQYDFGARDLLLDLGYGKTSDTLEIRFSEAGEYRFERIELIAQPMAHYAEKLAPLAAAQAESVAIDGNRVTIGYDLDRPALACVAIPFSQGWRATVDGEVAEILPANVMYMGVMIPEGPHTIELVYQTPGLRLGAALSLAGLAAALIADLVSLARRRRRSRAD